jgi:hypothetical protein
VVRRVGASGADVQLLTARLASDPVLAPATGATLTRKSPTKAVS